MVQPAIRSRPSTSVAAEVEIGHALDAESRDWLQALSDTGPTREAAVERLHALLLRAARFEVARRQYAGGVSGGSGDSDDLAMHAADDALVAILGKLASYRGHSRFTTWAYKFALLEAAVKVRRRPWHGSEVRSSPTAGHSCSTTGTRLPTASRRLPSSSTRCATPSPRC